MKTLNDTVYTCEKHFKPDEIEICKSQFTYKKQLNVWIIVLCVGSVFGGFVL